MLGSVKEVSQFMELIEKPAFTKHLPCVRLCSFLRSTCLCYRSEEAERLVARCEDRQAYLQSLGLPHSTLRSPGGSSGVGETEGKEWWAFKRMMVPACDQGT